jgi:hypothetical protein
LLIINTYNMEESISLRDYISVVTQLAFKACQVAKECAEDPKLKKYEKGINDPVTEVCMAPRRQTTKFRLCSSEASIASSPNSG